MFTNYYFVLYTYTHVYILLTVDILKIPFRFISLFILKPDQVSDTYFSYKDPQRQFFVYLVYTTLGLGCQEYTLNSFDSSGRGIIFVIFTQ